MTRVLKSLMVLFEPETNLEHKEDSVNYKGFRFNSFKNCVSRIWASAKDARERMKGCVWGEFGIPFLLYTEQFLAYQFHYWALLLF